MYEHKSIFSGEQSNVRKEKQYSHKNPKLMENNFVNSVSIGRKEWWRFASIKIYPTVR
jgi:hypothetical protein